MLRPVTGMVSPLDFANCFMGDAVAVRWQRRGRLAAKLWQKNLLSQVFPW
jgi:hypothetical protein